MWVASVAFTPRFVGALGADASWPKATCTLAPPVAIAAVVNVTLLSGSKSDWPTGERRVAEARRRRGGVDEL